MIAFGSAKFSSAARDLGHLLGGSKRTAEEVKSEFIPEEVDQARDAIKDLKTEALYGAEQDTRRRRKA